MALFSGQSNENHIKDRSRRQTELGNPESLYKILVLMSASCTANNNYFPQRIRHTVSQVSHVQLGHGVAGQSAMPPVEVLGIRTGQGKLELYLEPANSTALKHALKSAYVVFDQVCAYYI